MATAAERRATSLRNLQKARAARAEGGESPRRVGNRTLPPAALDTRDRQFSTSRPNPKAVVAATVIAFYAMTLHAYGYDGTYPGDGGDGDTPDEGDDEDDNDGGEGDAPAPQDCPPASNAALDKLNASFGVIETRQTLAAGVGCAALAAWEGANLELNSAAASYLLNAAEGPQQCARAAEVTAQHTTWLATGAWPGNNLDKPACVPGDGEGEQGDGEGGDGEGDGEGGEGDEGGEGGGDGDEQDGAPPCFASDVITNTQYEAVKNYTVGLMSQRAEVPEMVAAGFSVAQWAEHDPDAVGYYYMDGAMLRLANIRGDNAARARIVNAIVTGGENPCVFGQNLNGLRIEIGEDFLTLYPNPGAFTWPA